MLEKHEDTTSRIKYPRTYHLPWSEGVSSDDKIISSLNAFVDQRIIATEKFDGENTSLYRNGMHARSLDGRTHFSRNWVKHFLSGFAHEIPEDWRICGENMYAQHSIGYENLPSYFLGFSVWDDRNVSLSWDDTLDWFDTLGITPVKVLYDGVFDEKVLKTLWTPKDKDHMEGYVIRLAGEIHYDEFNSSVAKFVRSGHVQTDTHWMHNHHLQRNKLALK